MEVRRSCVLAHRVGPIRHRRAPRPHGELETSLPGPACELAPARVTRYTVAEAEVTPPPHYRARQIREIRDQMELSQPIFAAALNVSADTIRAWEQGKREPDGPTLRLLEVAEQHPELFLNKLRKRTRGSRPNVRSA